MPGTRSRGLGGVFRGKIWDARRPIEEAAFASADALCRFMRPEVRWRDGIARKHRSSIFPADYLQLFLGPPADILVTHEAPAAHRYGWQAIDELAEALGVQVVIHGHHHRDIDYVGEGLLSAAAPFRAFGVDKGSHLVCSRDPQEQTGLGGLPLHLLDLVTQVLGPEGQTWLDKPHPLLDELYRLQVSVWMSPGLSATLN